MNKIDRHLIAELDTIQDPQDLIKEIFTRFDDRAAIGTSGQITGCVMIDMACAAGVKPRIFTIDTLRLFPETYQLFGEIEKKYGVKVERIQPNPEKIQKMVSEHGEYLFFDSKEKQEFCCHLRKVEPNDRVLETLDVWLTGLRADQSKQRASTPRFEIVSHGKDRRPILKVAPLVNWTEKEAWDYVHRRRVPVHFLLTYNQNGWRYESLGCMICTTPIGPHEPRRAGRWRWFNTSNADDKECGLHEQKMKEDEV